MFEKQLPSNNISQLLFFSLMPKCPQYITPLGNLITSSKYAPNKPATYGTPNCTDEGLFRQAMLSQYYIYKSGNNKLPKR